MLVHVENCADLPMPYRCRGDVVVGDVCTGADGIGDAETLHWVTDAGCVFAAGRYVSRALAAGDQTPPSARRQPIDPRAVRSWNWLTLVRASPAPPGSEERRW